MTTLVEDVGLLVVCLVILSGAAAALVAAYGWKWLWQEWEKHRSNATAKLLQRQSQFAFVRRRV